MERKAHGGLSPSSFSMVSACPRKYAFLKILRLPIDSDAPTDMTNFNIGKAVHKILELTNHEPGGYAFDSVLDICGEFELKPDYAALIFAMIKKLKSVHIKAGLKCVGCEIEIETTSFYGFVDAVMVDSKGKFWVVDIKTAGSYSPLLVPSLPSHPQLNLYALHAPEIAAKLGLKAEDFAGCRYRLVTKSKLIQGKAESVQDYIDRMTKAIRCYDFILPKEAMNIEAISKSHRAWFNIIEANKAQPSLDAFPQNFGNCMSYGRQCEVFQKCHNKTFTELQQIEYVEG